MNLPMIGRLLGHKSPLTTARYAHLVDNPAQAATDRIAANISASMAGKPAAEVLPLRRRGRLDAAGGSTASTGTPAADSRSSEVRSGFCIDSSVSAATTARK
ncbi:MAG: hypothetical protein ACK56I_31025, partial [bacterium]